MNSEVTFWRPVKKGELANYIISIKSTMSSSALKK